MVMSLLHTKNEDNNSVDSSLGLEAKFTEDGVNAVPDNVRLSTDHVHGDEFTHTIEVVQQLFDGLLIHLLALLSHTHTIMVRSRLVRYLQLY